MEITWYGQTCVRLRGRDAVVVADAYQSIVGPTGRGITADIATYSHPDDAPLAKAKGRRTRDGKTVLPSSLESSFALDGPGEYEVKNVLLTGVRTLRDEDANTKRGPGTAFVVEFDGLHTTILGDVGQPADRGRARGHRFGRHRLRPVGGPNATKTAELIAQLDPMIVVAMPVCPDEADCAEALAKFFHEMGGEPTPQAKLAVTISTLPSETTAVLLESRGKA